MRTAPLGQDCHQGSGSPQFGVGEADTPQADKHPPPNFLKLSGQTRERRVERKGGKFQGPGLESNKGSVFLPFHQQTSTQEEV